MNHKLREFKFSSDNGSISTPRDFGKLLMLIGIERLGGHSKVLEIIRCASFKRPEYRARAKAKIKELVQFGIDKGIEIKLS